MLGKGKESDAAATHGTTIVDFNAAIVEESVKSSSTSVTTTERFSAEIIQRILWNLSLFTLIQFRQVSRSFRDIIDNNWFIGFKILELQSQPDSEDAARLKRLLAKVMPETSDQSSVASILFLWGIPLGCNRHLDELLALNFRLFNLGPDRVFDIRYLNGSPIIPQSFLTCPTTLPSVTGALYEERDFSIHDIVLAQGGHSIVSFGHLYHQDSNDKPPVAVKRAMRSESKGYEPEYIAALQREINILGEIKKIGPLSELSCSYITEPLSVGKCDVAFRFYRHGDLYGFVSRNHRHLSFVRRLLLSRSLLQCMLYLEKINLLHRDLKATNVLISDDGTLRLGDFALAKFTNDKSCVSYGYITFQSPKIVSKMIEIQNTGSQTQDHYTLSDEIYSLTLLLYQIFTSLLPYEEFKIHLHLHDLGEFNEELQLGNKPRIPRTLKASIQALIQRGLDLNEDNRPRYTEIQAVLTAEINDCDIQAEIKDPLKI